MTTKPFCFVLMPFGEKPDGSGRSIDFDRIYAELIAPAIRAADLEPIRADEKQGGGIIHKPMYERLILCDYAVADLTTANANVFYELGVRHAVRPHTTISIHEEQTRLPFDVAPFRSLPYRLAADGTVAGREPFCRQLTARLLAARAPQPDSPVFQLVECVSPPPIDHTKTDIFRERTTYGTAVKERLAEAREPGANEGAATLRAIAAELAPMADQEAGVVIDLFLSFRAVKDWQAMIELVAEMTPPLAETVLVQEQLAFALNRAGKSAKAERVLLEVIAKRGPSSETYGLLGRIYKDQWQAALQNNETALAAGHLDKAIDAYRRGFETDWRDAYPGVNLVTLLTVRNPDDPELPRLLPVVRYGVERKIAAGVPDYWDHATLLELAVLTGDEADAGTALAASLAVVREPWEPETTARNLALIRTAREARGEAPPWARKAEETLRRRAG
ncbi:MAG: DUF4071 domain-containing protein [Desulfobulbaceae bacterium]|nr:DUF4071 domain-containing protein [Desulfobulbaceae bacterium]